MDVCVIGYLPQCPIDDVCVIVKRYNELVDLLIIIIILHFMI